MHFSAISQWAYWYFFLHFRFPLYSFQEETPDLLQRANVKFRTMFPRHINRDSCNEINVGTQCDIESLSNRLKITEASAHDCGYFHGKYARGYANVRCSADLWFMHWQNEYAEISDPKMKMVARRGRKIAADASTTCWECSWLEIVSVMKKKKREEEHVKYKNASVPFNKMLYQLAT